MQSVTLNFAGRDYTVSEDKTWGLIEQIEETVTMAWLAPKLSEKQVPLVKIYRAYADALKYAGAKDVTIDQLREGIDFARGIQMGYELAAILSLASPPLSLRESSPSPTAPPKKKPATKKQQ